MKKSYLFFPLAAIILALSVYGVNRLAYKLAPEPVNDTPIIMDNPELTNPTSEETETPAISQEAPKDEAPAAKYINTVVFTSQAPYAKWDTLHDEACEEASLIMAHYYLNDLVEIEMRTAEDEIQDMVAFQKTLFGSHKDLNAKEIIELAKEYYNENHEIVYLTEPKEEETKELDEEISIETTIETTTVTTNDEIENLEGNNINDDKDKSNEEVIFLQKIRYMKEELAKGNLFIIPAAGRELENPYFQTPGPLYHALVVIGYDEVAREFITNDPGTRRGEGFRYSYETLWNAIHDFPGKKTDILEGNKTVILVKK